MLKKIKNFFCPASPRYFYQLDEICYVKTIKKNLYVFKIYGSPAFAKWTFREIQEEQSLRWLINPDDLVQIYIHEERAFHENSKYRVKEVLRENNYILSAKNETLMISGEEFTHNLVLMEQTNSLDVYKIAYHTGFQAGRIFSKEISGALINYIDFKEQDNVVDLMKYSIKKQDG